MKMGNLLKNTKSNCSVVYITLFLLALFAENYQLKAQPIHDGFLAITGEADYSIPINNQSDPIIKLPVYLEGAAPFYELTTKIKFTPELLHLTDYYRQNANFLRQDQMSLFSLASIQITQRLIGGKMIQLNSGVKIGHTGILQKTVKPTPLYTIYISPVFTTYVILANSLMMKIPLQFPVNVYSSNFKPGFRFQSNAEIIFDPKKQVYNPSPDTVFITLGARYEYINSIPYNAKNLQLFSPYVKFSILY